LTSEIENPLTAIKIFTQYFPKYRDDPEFLRKYSKIVGHEVDRIDDLIHQLLDFSKQTPPHLEQTNIIKLIDDTLIFLNNNFLKNNIKVTKEYSSNTILVTLDHSQIRQALLNLFLNAIEAMPCGGIININIEERITNQPDQNNQVSISITDNGIGIKPTDINHIFEPFFTNKDKGTGLGLAVTYGIIQGHKGKISVASEVDKGTIFTIELHC
jgi:signal transduction histidine kinase